MFYRNFQIVKMTTNHKCIVLSIEDKITTSECFDKGSSKSDIACEDKITVLSVSCVFIWLSKLWLSEQVLIPKGSDNQGSTVYVYAKYTKFDYLRGGDSSSLQTGKETMSSILKWAT